MDEEDFLIFEDVKGISINEYKSFNSNVLILSKNSLRIKFNYYKLNNTVFVNINGEHLFDFRVLLLIDCVSNIKTNESIDINIKHGKLGEIIIKNCNIELFQKGLQIINDWINRNKNIIKEIYGYF